MSTITITMQQFDSYGDGWNDAYVRIYNSAGAEVATHTLEGGASGSDVFDLDDNADYTWTFSGGNWISEAKFEMTAADGTVLASAEGAEWDASGVPNGGSASGSFTLGVPVPPSLTDDLVARFSFESDASDSVGSNDGSVTGATFYDGHVVFDGSDDFISIPDPAELSAATWTISQWVKTSNASGRQDFLAKWYSSNGNWPSIGLGTDGGLLKAYYRGDTQGGINTLTGPSISDDAWHNIVYAKSSDTIRVYVDGAEVAQAAFSGTIPSTSDLFLGAWDGSILGYAKEHWFDGSYDDLRIWSRSLSASDVTDLYDAGRDPAEDGDGGEEETGPIAVEGYYPIYNTEAGANAASPDGSGSHSHELGGVTYYMPNGLTMGVNQFHGDYGSTPSLTDDLVARFSFEADASDSVGSNDGSVTGATFSDGHIVFDGSDDFVSIPHDDAHGFGGDTISVSAWVKTTSTQKSTIWLKAYGEGGGDSLFTLEVNNGQANKARLFWRNSAAGGSGECFSTTDINDGSWHHIVGVKSGSDLHLYVDGTLESSASDLSGDFTASLFYLGKWDHQSYGAQDFFAGSVDDFRIWSRSLSASDVTDLYDAGQDPAEDDGGDDAYDWTQEGNLTNIVKFVSGEDAGSNRSHMFMKNDSGNTVLYFTQDLQTWSAFSSYGPGDHGIYDIPVCAAYGPAGRVIVGTESGCVYLIELDSYSVPTSYTKVHDNGDTGRINQVHFGVTSDAWLIEFDEKVYTMPAEGGSLSLRMSIPAGSQVFDFAQADDATSILVRKSDFTFATFIAMPGWTTIHDETAMRAIFTSLGVSDVNYDYERDLWVASDASYNVISTDQIVDWLLS